MIFFTSDTHFCHKEIINLYKRPFESIEDMHSQIIRNWNRTVKPDDDIYILGDFLYKGHGFEANTILEKLNGKKYLIKGNHEDYLDDIIFKKENFEWIKEYHTFEYKGIKIVLFHYPIFEWDNFYKNTIHLYGHIHNANIQKQKRRYSKMDKRAVNIGVDSNNFTPVSIDYIYEITECEKIIKEVKEQETKKVLIKKKVKPVIKKEMQEKIDNARLFWHLTSIENIESIFSRSLLSRDKLRELNVVFRNVSENRDIKIRDELAINKYVPFHFLPWNPFDMLILKNRIKGERYCYITVDQDVMKKLKPKVILGYPNIKKETDLIDLEKCEKDIENIRRNTDFKINKNRFHALGECLIPHSISKIYFDCIIVETKKDKDFIMSLPTYRDNKIIVEKGYFDIAYFSRVYKREYPEDK